MVTLDSVRRLLDIADPRQDPYAVARVSAGLLALNPQDPHALAHHARALAVLELGAAARRVLGDADKPLAELLEKTPAGLIPWSSRQRRFQANLRALADRGVNTAEILAAWEAASSQYELHQSRDGNFQVLDIQQPVWKAWQGAVAGGLEDHKAITSRFPAEDCRGKMVSPLAFEGLGHGWLLPHLLKISEQSFLSYSAAMYVVEPDFVALCMVLHMQDLQEWLKGPRLRMYLGADATGQLLADLHAHPTWTLPTRFVLNPLRLRPPAGLQAKVEPLIEERSRQQKESLSRITAYYSGFDAAAWRKRFAEAAHSGPPLRVLGITTRFSTVLRYSMEELQGAAMAAGATFEISMEPDDQSLEKNYLEMIERLKPDLLVTISRMRYEVPDLPRNVPALCWDQDNLPCMRDPRALADMKGLTFVAGHGAVFGSMHLGWPLEACIFCHPAGMTHRYKPGPVSHGEAAFASDFSYVSHASGSPEQLRDSLLPKWKSSPQFLPLFNTACGEIIASARTGRTWEFLELQALVRQIPGGEDAPANVVNALIVDLRLLVDRVFRHQTLEWVSRWCDSRGRQLRIWGNGWADHPTLGKHAAGVALPGEQAQAVFRASRVNLQIIETGVIHSRLLDGWAAGGFFLIRQAHRTADEVRISATWRIGQLTLAEGIETIGDLEQRGGEELRRLWGTLAGEYEKYDKGVAFPGFGMWRYLPPPQVLIPGLERIMFNDEARFGALAAEYVSGDGAGAARERMMSGIRDMLQKRLSYDARWREFVGHIAGNVGRPV